MLRNLDDQSNVFQIPVSNGHLCLLDKKNIVTIMLKTLSALYMSMDIVKKLEKNRLN